MKLVKICYSMSRTQNTIALQNVNTNPNIRQLCNMWNSVSVPLSWPLNNVR